MGLCEIPGPASTPDLRASIQQIQPGFDGAGNVRNEKQGESRLVCQRTAAAASAMILRAAAAGLAAAVMGRPTTI